MEKHTGRLCQSSVRAIAFSDKDAAAFAWKCWSYREKELFQSEPFSYVEAEAAHWQHVLQIDLLPVANNVVPPVMVKAVDRFTPFVLLGIEEMQIVHSSLWCAQILTGETIGYVFAEIGGIIPYTF